MLADRFARYFIYCKGFSANAVSSFARYKLNKLNKITKINGLTPCAGRCACAVCRVLSPV